VTYVSGLDPIGLGRPEGFEPPTHCFEDRSVICAPMCTLARRPAASFYGDYSITRLFFFCSFIKFDSKSRPKNSTSSLEPLMVCNSRGKLSRAPELEARAGCRCLPLISKRKANLRRPRDAKPRGPLLG